MSIVLIGGLAMRKEEFAPLLPFLGALDIAATAYDNLLVGQGPREIAQGPLQITQQAEHLWNRIDQENPSAEPVALFGISMGGMIAATMAKMRPERISHLVLAATSANTLAAPALSDELYAEWINARTPASFDKAITIAFGKSTLTSHPQVKQAYFDYRFSGGNQQSAVEFVAQLDSIRHFPGERIYTELAACSFPITVLTGEEDALFTQAHAKEIDRLLPRATRVEIKKCGHMLHLENPRALISIVASIMASVVK